MFGYYYYHCLDLFVLLLLMMCLDMGFETLASKCCEFYVYIYIYIYIHTHNTYVYIYIYIHICICIYIYIYVCVFIHIIMRNDRSVRKAADFISYKTIACCIAIVTVYYIILYHIILHYRRPVSSLSFFRSRTPAQVTRTALFVVPLSHSHSSMT